MGGASGCRIRGARGERGWERAQRGRAESLGGHWTRGRVGCEGAQDVGVDAVSSDALDLAGGVVVVGRAEDEQGTELGVQPSPASADEARVAVRHQPVRHWQPHVAAERRNKVTCPRFPEGAVL